MLDSSDTVTVTNNGINVVMTNGMPKVYYKTDSITDDEYEADFITVMTDDDYDVEDTNDDEGDSQESDHDKSKFRSML